MRHTALLLSALLIGCQSTTGDAEVRPQRTEEIDHEARTALLEAVKGLEGEWIGEQGPTEFHVSSGGSAVRELMFPGEPHEMTNMYTLDGNGLSMTHYCGAGNQPRMRATSIREGRIAFESTGVSDLDASDGAYMGAMTLVIVDANNIEQHWTGRTVDGELAEDHSMVFRYARVD